MKAKYKPGDIVMFSTSEGTLRGKVAIIVVISSSFGGGGQQSMKQEFGYWLEYTNPFSPTSVITHFVMEDLILGMETEPAAPLMASACTCGARATGSPGHASYCDAKEIA